MIFQQIAVGGDRNFAYLVGCPETRLGAVFDPSYAPDRVAAAARKEGLTVRYLVNTHGHSDHTNGNETFARLTGADVVAHPDCPVPATVTPGHGDTLAVGTVTLRFLHTPGHTPDSMSVLVDERLIITGDTLFVGKIGGTRTEAQARAEYESLHQQLLTLPDHVVVYPGHDVGVRPSSTIGEERRTNPFLLQPDFEAFLDLKRTWLQYKAEHGIT